jgi:hypothetical protein
MVHQMVFIAYFLVYELKIGDFGLATKLDFDGEWQK